VLDPLDAVSEQLLRGRNYWPDGSLGFREDVVALFNVINALGQARLLVFATALEMLAYFFEPLFSDINQASLRGLCHPPARGRDKSFGEGPHTDDSCTRVLRAPRSLVLE
jgi:isopenicillin N synthase-like dioxygenase